VDHCTDTVGNRPDLTAGKQGNFQAAGIPVILYRINSRHISRTQQIHVAFACYDHNTSLHPYSQKGRKLHGFVLLLKINSKKYRTKAFAPVLLIFK
jgi:hypothetical protein